MREDLTVGIEVMAEESAGIEDLFKLAAGTYGSGRSDGVLLLSAQPIIGQGRKKLPYAVEYVNDIGVQIGSVIPVATSGDVVRLMGWLIDDYSDEAAEAREAGEPGEMIDLTALQDGAYVEILYDTRINFGQIVLVNDIDVFCAGELRCYLKDSRPVMLLDKPRFDPRQLDSDEDVPDEDAPDEEGDGGKEGDAAEAENTGDAGGGDDGDFVLSTGKDK